MMEKNTQAGWRKSETDLGTLGQSGAMFGVNVVVKLWMKWANTSFDIIFANGPILVLHFTLHFRWFLLVIHLFISILILIWFRGRSPTHPCHHILLSNDFHS